MTDTQFSTQTSDTGPGIAPVAETLPGGAHAAPQGTEIPAGGAQMAAPATETLPASGAPAPMGDMDRTAPDANMADDTGPDPDIDARADGDWPGGAAAYADFDLPDGITVTGQDMAAFRGLSGQMGLTQDQAQQLLTFEAGRLRQVDDQLAGQRVQQAETWAEAARTDAEFGGDNFDRNVGVARQAIQQFGTNEVQELLDATGLGSHPEFIRMFWKMGQSVASDGAVIGGHGGGSTRLDNRSLFPNSNHN